MLSSLDFTPWYFVNLKSYLANSYESYKAPKSKNKPTFNVIVNTALNFNYMVFCDFAPI